MPSSKTGIDGNVTHLPNTPDSEGLGQTQIFHGNSPPRHTILAKPGRPMVPTTHASVQLQPPHTTPEADAESRRRDLLMQVKGPVPPSCLDIITDAYKETFSGDRAKLATKATRDFSTRQYQTAGTSFTEFLKGKDTKSHIGDGP